MHENKAWLLDNSNQKVSELCSWFRVCCSISYSKTNWWKAETIMLSFINLHFYFDGWKVCTWSVILRFRGSPPSRSNCTKPNSNTLHGNCNKIQINAATTFLAVRFSSISNLITSVMLPIESIFEMKHNLERVVHLSYLNSFC